MGFLTNLADKTIEEYPSYHQSCELVTERVRQWLASGIVPTDGDIAYILHRGLAATLNGLSDDMKTTVAAAVAALILRGMSPEALADFVAGEPPKFH
ncbi:MAG: hypothetical protein V4764_02875 [Burkholderia sp.]